MRASILCNSNFVGNKYYTLTFISLPKVALRKVSSLCPPSKLLYRNLAIIYSPINVNPFGGGGVRARGGDLMPETIPCRAFDRVKRPRGRDI